MLKFVADIGTVCREYMDERMHNLTCHRLQADEIWQFCYAKDKNVPDAMPGALGSVARIGHALVRAVKSGGRARKCRGPISKRRKRLIGAAPGKLSHYRARSPCRSDTRGRASTRRFGCCASDRDCGRVGAPRGPGTGRRCQAPISRGGSVGTRQRAQEGDCLSGRRKRGADDAAAFQRDCGVILSSSGGSVMRSLNLGRTAVADHIQNRPANIEETQVANWDQSIFICCTSQWLNHYLARDVPVSARLR